MTRKEFEKIEKLLEKAEDEALNEGVDITSAKFQSILEEIKVKILRDKGITLKEYEEIEDSVEEKPKPYIPEGISMIKGEEGKRGVIGEQGIKGIKGEKGEPGISIKGERGIKGNEGERGNQGEQGESGEDGKSIDKKDVEKMVKQETKKQLNDALKPSIFGKPKILNKKDIDKQIKAYIKENLQIRIPYGGGRNFQFADGETPTGDVDGSNKVFTLAYTPDPLTSLAVYVNTTRKTLTTDYALSGTTLTMVSAPRSGAILRCDYRY